MSDRPLSAHDRLACAVAYATGAAPKRDVSGWSALRSVSLVEPAAIRTALVALVDQGCRVVVTGTLDRRLVLIENQFESWTAADLSGRPHRSRAWPAWTAGHLDVAELGRWLSLAHITREGLRRLLQPRLLLASLYHPEYFPLPRFRWPSPI